MAQRGVALGRARGTPAQRAPVTAASPGVAALRTIDEGLRRTPRSVGGVLLPGCQATARRLRARAGGVGAGPAVRSGLRQT